MRRYILVILIVCVCSCLRTTMPPEFLPSPSGLYKLKVEINKSKADKTKYDCILLTLFDSSGRQMTQIQTGASDNMKWAVAWYPDKDTVIVNSRDIGIYAYKVENPDRLKAVPVDQDISLFADRILQMKYAAH